MIKIHPGLSNWALPCLCTPWPLGSTHDRPRGRVDWSEPSDSPQWQPLQHAWCLHCVSSPPAMQLKSTTKFHIFLLLEIVLARPPLILFFSNISCIAGFHMITTLRKTPTRSTTCWWRTSRGFTRGTWISMASLSLGIGHPGVFTCTLRGSLAIMDGTILDTRSSSRFVVHYLFWQWHHWY